MADLDPRDRQPPTSPRVVSGVLLSSDRAHVLRGLRKPASKRPLNYHWHHLRRWIVGP